MIVYLPYLYLYYEMSCSPEIIDFIEKCEKIERIKESKGSILPNFLIMRIIREAFLLRHEEVKNSHKEKYKGVIDYLKDCTPIEEEPHHYRQYWRPGRWFYETDNGDYEPQFFRIFEWDNIIELKTHKNNGTRYADVSTYKKLGTLIGCFDWDRDSIDTWEFCSTEESYTHYEPSSDDD